MQLKYDKYLYEHSGITGDGDEFTHQLRRKMVKTRKEHTCCLCQNKINIGDYALRETAIIVDVGRCACYICTHCIEEWLVESGQIQENNNDTKTT